MKDYILLLKPVCLAVVAVLALYCEKIKVVGALTPWHLGEQLPWYVVLLLTLAMVLLAAAAFVINDYFDVKIDRINNVDKQIVTRTISRDGAMHVFYILTALGILAGGATTWLTRSGSLAILLVLVPGLTWFYSSSYKRQLLVGDIVFSLCFAMIPLAFALANDGYLHYLYGDIVSDTEIVWSIYAQLGVEALKFFLAAWVVLLLLCIREVEGDREMECHTIPVVWGVRTAKIVIGVLCALYLGAIVLGVVNY